MTIENRAEVVGLALTKMSHQIKNLLQSLNGGCHLIEDALYNGRLDQVERGWQIVKQKQEIVSSILLDCLAYLDTPVPNFVATDVNETVRRAVSAIGQRARHSRVQIDFARFDGDSRDILVDPVLLDRALNNVLAVSVDSCRHNSEGKIEVSVSEEIESQSILIEVVDDGVQLNQQQLDEFCASDGIVDDSGIAGLSMAVSRILVEKLGGRLNVTNNDGPGKNFTILLSRESEYQEITRF